MSDEEKMLWIFDKVYGDLGSSVSLVVRYDSLEEPCRIDVMKDGQLCWSKTKLDLLFDVLTRHMS